VKLGLVVGLGDWAGTPVEAYRSTVESLIASARWADGKYHYEVDATLSRLSLSDLRPERERGKSAVRPRPTSAPSPSAETPAVPPPASPPPSAPSPSAAPEKPPVPDEVDDLEPVPLEADEDEPPPADDGL
jgi:hypothetical protein